MTSLETIRFFLSGFLICCFFEGVRIVWRVREGKPMSNLDTWFMTFLLLLSLVQFISSIYEI